MPDFKTKLADHCQDIVTKYPRVFEHAFAFHIPRGWAPIVESGVATISRCNRDMRFRQIGEAMGGLLVSFYRPDEVTGMTHLVVEKMTLACSQTCETCGAHARLRTDAERWWHTLCDSCYVAIYQKASHDAK